MGFFTTKEDMEESYFNIDYSLIYKCEWVVSASEKALKEYKQIKEIKDQCFESLPKELIKINFQCIDKIIKLLEELKEFFQKEILSEKLTNEIGRIRRQGAANEISGARASSRVTKLISNLLMKSKFYHNKLISLKELRNKQIKLFLATIKQKRNFLSNPEAVKMLKCFKRLYKEKETIAIRNDLREMNLRMHQAIVAERELKKMLAEGYKKETVFVINPRQYDRNFRGRITVKIDFGQYLFAKSYNALIKFIKSCLEYLILKHSDIFTKTQGYNIDRTFLFILEGRYGKFRERELGWVHLYRKEGDIYVLNLDPEGKKLEIFLNKKTVKDIMDSGGVTPQRFKELVAIIVHEMHHLYDKIRKRTTTREEIEMERKESEIRKEGISRFSEWVYSDDAEPTFKPAEIKRFASGEFSDISSYALGEYMCFVIFLGRIKKRFKKHYDVFDRSQIKEIHKQEFLKNEAKFILRMLAYANEKRFIKLFIKYNKYLHLPPFKKIQGLLE